MNISTATAVSALSLVSHKRHAVRIAAGTRWLTEHQNPDGGWGDTGDSPSNLSTTWLARAAFRIAGAEPESRRCVERAEGYLAGIAGSGAQERALALKQVYGADRTFAAPILAMCALADLTPWQGVPALPFELACLPGWLYPWLRLQVVSYALPALIGLGQLIHARRPSSNPLARRVRSLAAPWALRKLKRLQPSSGGFLEAVPLTSFVVMSLAANGKAGHPVAALGAQFLERAARPDGSWPIEVSLDTWLTSMAVQALGRQGPEDGASRQWLLAAQRRERDPYTGARAGGWAWNDLPGATPDVDDTSAALLALGAWDDTPTAPVRLGLRWLFALQNPDGGWPTFCRGWGRLPFDRSAPDLTAHALRAIERWKSLVPPRKAARAVARGLDYLRRTQQDDGSWIPLWFGNQSAPDKRNRVYGAASALTFLAARDRARSDMTRGGVAFLVGAQNPDGSWGGAPGVAGSVEETALAVDALGRCQYNGEADTAARRGGAWLVHRAQESPRAPPAPIGLYFDRLWYSEKLYPVIWTVAALGRLLRRQTN